MKYFSLFLMLFFIIACQAEQKPEHTLQSQPQVLQSNGIEIMKPWARPASAGANSAAYLHIFNGSNRADTLISSDANITAQAEIHESFEKNGLSSMRPVNRLVIPADSIVHLSPGGYHIMLKQLNRGIAVGDSLSLKLDFAHAGTRSVKAVIQLSN